MKYTTDELITIQMNMQRFGGGFVKALGEAMAHADFENKPKLVKAFPKYMEQYLTIGKDHCGPKGKEGPVGVKEVFSGAIGPSGMSCDIGNATVTDECEMCGLEKQLSTGYLPQKICYGCAPF